ncbi:LPS assembly lipoprotein LptE [Bathymodiolus japonicus methanotrophic gill symbiont]|uniref:LPS-assembly lipoprotein LptE n=1 Tax=Bathymodiolus japonicus methanotrophic gill symbiont TaxID=113269 RepID=UPI001C8EC3C5|nr:LPS assembly lipoprotein LptE [Bathymodiolus japonicus methanotrophic gill symbiont]
MLLLTLLLLTACGYHLRGAIDLPEALNKMYVKGASPELSAAIERTFRTTSGELVASPEEAGMILNVLDEDYQRRTVSLDVTGYSNEYELIYRLSFDLLDSEGKELVSNQTIEVMESYYNAQTSTTLLSKDNEEIVLRRELYEEAVRSVIQRARAELKKKFH